MVLIHDLPSVKTLGYFQGAGDAKPKLAALSPQRHRARSGPAVIVERGQLVNAGRRFPAQHRMSVASADECLVGKPIEFADAAFGFGAKGNTGRRGGGLGQGHFVGGKRDLRRMASPREKIAPDRRQKWRWQFSRHPGPLEEREQVRRPEFIRLSLQLSRAVVVVDPKPGGRVYKHLAMDVADGDRRYAGNKPG